MNKKVTQILDKLFTNDISDIILEFWGGYSINIHSYDIATKSMAVAIIQMTIPVEQLPLETQIANLFKITHVDVWDLSDGQKDRKDIITPAINLKNKISELECYDKPDYMFYEYQMSANDKSRTMMHYMIYDYADRCELIKVVPAKKNKVYIDNSLKYQNFVSKYSTTYVANKKHTSSNFVRWCEIFNIDISHIKKKNIDDAADAVMQVIGYFKDINKVSR